jgi:hypothetical protein
MAIEQAEQNTKWEIASAKLAGTKRISLHGILSATHPRQLRLVDSEYAMTQPMKRTEVTMAGEWG